MDKAIVLVSYFFPPLNEIACLRTGQWAKYLARAGRRVIVLTARKSAVDGAMNLRIDLPPSVTVIELEFAPEWLVGLICKLKNKPSGDGAGSPSRYVWPSSLASTFKYPLKVLYRFLSSLMGSLFDYRILWAIKANKRLRELLAENSVSCIVSSYGPAASHLTVYWALRRAQLRTKWILDYRDPWVGSNITGARFPFSVVEKQLQARMIERHAFALTTVSEEWQEQLARQISGVPVHLIQNGIDLDQYRKSGLGAFASDWETSKGSFPGLKNGIFRIVYTGMIYRGTRNPAPLFRAINNIRNKVAIRIVVEFFGKPGDLDAIVKSEGAKDFVCHRGIISHHESLQIQGNADLLLVLETGHEKGVLPAKTFEYLASGRPILAVGVGSISAIGRLLESTNAGVALGSDAETIERELSEYLRLGRHPTYRLREEDLERYSRERQINSLLTLIDSDVA